MRGFYEGEYVDFEEIPGTSKPVNNNENEVIEVEAEEIHEGISQELIDRLHSRIRAGMYSAYSVFDEGLGSFDQGNGFFDKRRKR